MLRLFVSNRNGLEYEWTIMEMGNGKQNKLFTYPTGIRIRIG